MQFINTERYDNLPKNFIKQYYFKKYEFYMHSSTIPLPSFTSQSHLINLLTKKPLLTKLTSFDYKMWKKQNERKKNLLKVENSWTLTNIHLKKYKKKIAEKKVKLKTRETFKRKVSHYICNPNNLLKSKLLNQFGCKKCLLDGYFHKRPT